MNTDRPALPDDFQQAWQAHSSQTRITIAPDLLHQEVRRNQREFRTNIVRRDVVEIGVAIFLLPVWMYLGTALALPWTWYLTVPALIWGAGFIVFDRIRHPQKISEPGEPLVRSVKDSLTQVEHQIWLLRHVLWWYLLPFAISILAFFAQVVWTSRSHGRLEAPLVFLGLTGLLVAVYSYIYSLNQRAVRVDLEPRREELLALLTSLKDEMESEEGGESPVLTDSERMVSSPRRLTVAELCFAAILLIGLPGVLIFASRLGQLLPLRMELDYPKKSPFSAVRWEKSQAEVKIGEEWFQLVSLDELPATDIVAFCQETYGSKWRKRFEEDLVEVLTRMGHPPSDNVTLEVQSLTSPATQVLENIPVTEGNRRTIYRANREQ